jgi:nucleoside-diphosphate-sugar epimerase
VQDFIHVDDVAGGLLALASQDMKSGIYNLGSGKPHTVGDVVNRVAAHFGRPTPFPATAPKTGFWADMAKTTKAIGWTPAITLDDGIGRSLAALDCVQ